MELLFFFLGLFILYLVIKFAIDFSQTSTEIREVKQLLVKIDKSLNNETEKREQTTKEHDDYEIIDTPIDECPACGEAVDLNNKNCPSCGILLGD